MPRLNADGASQAGASSFGFSQSRLKSLGATKYTIVYIYADVSGSTTGFSQQIEQAVIDSVNGCRNLPDGSPNPMAENMLVCVVAFDHALHEIHPPLPLSEISDDMYRGEFSARGGTALRDAVSQMYERMLAEGEDLYDADFEVNAIAFVISDGLDEHSQFGPEHVCERRDEMMRAEKLDSYRAIVISINNDDPRYHAAMDSFGDKCGFDQIVRFDELNDEARAKMAGFISQSSTEQSQGLGTGSASKPLAV